MTAARTRFAPSPTGYVHVGGIRTALFAWLVARQSHGQFVLRIEDTDQTRAVKGSEQHIMSSLRALGLDYDEGPDIGGPYGPYRQSERLAHYTQWAQRLIKAGRAYGDPYTPAQVQLFREQAQKEKRPFVFRNHRPANPPAWEKGVPLRFKAEPKDYTWSDAVMGELRAGEEAIDDFILIKSDGYPTYNFAHIVDDADMQITHVIRSQEFLASVPNYLNLYDALGLTRPVLATLPYVLAPDGKRKLSKRDGAKDVLDYIHDGFLPDALINFIASLGWNDGSEQEIFSRQELVHKFSLTRVGRGGAKFDEQRLMWMDGYYIRSLPLDVLYDKAQPFWPAAANKASDSYKKQVLQLVQERLKFLGELEQLTIFFFRDLPPQPELWHANPRLQALGSDQLASLLEHTKASIEQSDFSVDDITKRLNDLLTQTAQKPAVLFTLIRIATTQVPSSPGLAETLAVLGKETSLRRITTMLKAL